MSKDGRMTVLVADDQPRIHDVVRRILEPEFAVVDAVETGESLIEAARKLNPHVIIADISMPGLSGIEAIRTLNDDGEGNRPAVIFSAHADPALVRQALRVGASGYVLKARAPFDLKAAVKAALDGEHFVSRGIGDDA